MKLEEMKPHTNPRYQRDEIGIGNAFADYFKPIARFAGDRNIWYVYDGVVWHPDENALAVAELAKKGFAYDESSAKYKNGRMTVAYLKDEFGGFAVHLLQK